MTNWYVVKAIAGREESVKRDILSRLENLGQSHNLRRIIVPTESRIVEKNGQKREVAHRVLPGYILVNCRLTDEVWGAIKNTKGVQGFVGAGGEPTPLSPAEVTKMVGGETQTAAKTMIEFEVGERIAVRQNQGHPLGAFEGTVIEVNSSQRKLKAAVIIFEREVPTEFSFDQVEKVS